MTDRKIHNFSAEARDKAEEFIRANGGRGHLFEIGNHKLVPGMKTPKDYKVREWWVVLNPKHAEQLVKEGFFRRYIVIN